MTPKKIITKKRFGASELRSQAETKISKRKKKTTSLPATEADALRLVHELQVHQIELEMQNEELMQAQESYRQYTDLYDFAPIGYFTLMRDGTIREVNFAGANLLGVERANLINRRLGLFISDKSLPIFNDFLEKLLSGEGKETCEVKLLKIGNKHHWMRIEASCFIGGQESRAMAIDITERKWAEDALQEQAYFSMLNPGPTLRIDTAGFVKLANPAAINLGFKEGSLVSSTIRELAMLNLLDCIHTGSMSVIEAKLNHRFYHLKVRGVPDLNQAFVFGTDITELKQAETILQMRLELSQFSDSHSLDEIMQKTLDEAEAMTGSQIGFAHFLEADQKTLHLQMWSTNTLTNMCTAEGKGQHYSVDKAGVWVECVSTRTPVIHNDYPSLAHRKGLPDGHAPVLRELIVPVLRNDLIVMIIGVGNKPTNYDNNDVEVLSQLAGLAWDIVQRKRVEEAFQKNKNLLMETEKIGNVGGWEFNIDTKEQTWTDEVYRIHEVDFTYTPTVKNGINFYAPASRSIIENAVQRAVENGEPFDEELEIITAKGNHRWVHAIGKVVPEQRRVFGFFQDITERKRVEEALRASEEKYRTVANFTYDWETWRGPDNTYLYVSPSCERITGHTEAEFLADTNLIVKITHPYDQPAVIEHFNETFKESKGQDLQLDFRIITPDGKIRWIEHTCTAVYGEEGQWLGRRESNRDITERKQVEDELRHAKEMLTTVNIELQTALAREKQLAYTDVLTGVSNRRHLYEIAEHEFEIAERYHQPLSVIMFDLDHFKEVNDTYGHAAGDQILQRVTQVACAELRSADVIGRYGGEEFVIILPMTNAQQAYPLAERIRAGVDALRVPTERGEASVTLSIGIVEMIDSMHTESVDSLIKNADATMYAAKQAGRNRTEIGN